VLHELGYKLIHAMVRPNRDKFSGYVEVDDAHIGGESEEKHGHGSENSYSCCS
jgi:hypothetical protein